MYDMIKICCLLLNDVFVNFDLDQHFLSLNNASIITELIYLKKKIYTTNLNRAAKLLTNIKYQ